MSKASVSVLLFVLLDVSALTAQKTEQQDTTGAGLRREMNKAAADYEAIRWTSAPHKLMQNAFCSERVGRFCLMFSSAMDSELPVEPEAVRKARSKAVDAFARGFALWPADTLVAGPMVRYLIEDGRAAEALEAARKHKPVATAPVWAIMLEGLALHVMMDDSTAEAAFATALESMLPPERARVMDMRVLLSKDEESKYAELVGRDRARYQERLWRIADPLYLTPGNESLVEHMARHIYGRILAVSPPYENFDWGPDTEILTVRYGLAAARSRNYGQGAGMSAVQHHGEQLPYVPPATITKGALTLHEPGAAWPYDTIQPRSGYAPLTVRTMHMLEHQIARYPAAGGGTVRADFQFKLDSAARTPAKVEVGVFLLDSTARIVGQVRDTIDAQNSLVDASLSLPLPRAVASYSIEARELGSRLSGRARYNFPVLEPGRLQVSDLVILSPTDAAPPKSRSDASFRPFSSLRIERGQPAGLFLETRGLKASTGRRVRYRVDLEVLEQSSPGVFSRAVRSLGRLLGVAGDPIAPRVSWSEEQPASDLTVIALKLGKMELEPGVKQLRVTLTDLESPGSTVIERLIRIDPAAR
jgi:hypothetical protein